jgi:hypothetical protein
LLQLPQPPMRMSTETTIWRAGAHAEENCAAAEEAGLPSASTALETWRGRIRENAAALRSRLWLGHPVVARVSESVAWSRRRRKTRAGAVRLRCKRRQSSRLLRSARQGAGCGGVWRRGGKARYFSVALSGVVWGPRAGVGIRGRAQRTFGVWGNPKEQTKHQAVVLSRYWVGVGVWGACQPR